MTPVSPRRLPVGIRGKSIGCYQDLQQRYGVMGSSPGRGGEGREMRGAGKSGQVSLSSSLQENDWW